MDTLAEIIVLGLITYYFTDILLLGNPHQPFRNINKYVWYTVHDTTEIWNYGLFDRIYSLFVSYSLDEKDRYNIQHSTLTDLLRCPKCLGFWVSLIVCAVFLPIFSAQIWFSVAAINVILFSTIEN